MARKKSRRRNRKRNKKISQHERRRRNDRKWFKKHPDRIPDECQDCGKTEVKLQFHHERYDIPRVGRFLCEECHMAVHGIKPNWEKRRNKAAYKNKYYKKKDENDG